MIELEFGVECESPEVQKIDQLAHVPVAERNSYKIDKLMDELPALAFLPFFRRFYRVSIIKL